MVSVHISIHDFQEDCVLNGWGRFAVVICLIEDFLSKGFQRCFGGLTLLLPALRHSLGQLYGALARCENRGTAIPWQAPILNPFFVRRGHQEVHSHAARLCGLWQYLCETRKVSPHLGRCHTVVNGTIFLRPISFFFLRWICRRIFTWRHFRLLNRYLTSTVSWSCFVWFLNCCYWYQMKG